VDDNQIAVLHGLSVLLCRTFRQSRRQRFSRLDISAEDVSLSDVSSCWLLVRWVFKALRSNKVVTRRLGWLRPLVLDNDNRASIRAGGDSPRAVGGHVLSTWLPPTLTVSLMGECAAGRERAVHAGSARSARSARSEPPRISWRCGTARV